MADSVRFRPYRVLPRKCLGHPQCPPRTETGLLVNVMREGLWSARGSRSLGLIILPSPNLTGLPAIFARGTLLSIVLGRTSACEYFGKVENVNLSQPDVRFAERGAMYEKLVQEGGAGYLGVCSKTTLYAEQYGEGVSSRSGRKTQPNPVGLTSASESFVDNAVQTGKKPHQSKGLSDSFGWTFITQRWMPSDAPTPRRCQADAPLHARKAPEHAAAPPQPCAAHLA